MRPTRRRTRAPTPPVQESDGTSEMELNESVQSSEMSSDDDEQIVNRHTIQEPIEDEEQEEEISDSEESVESAAVQQYPSAVDSDASESEDEFKEIVQTRPATKRQRARLNNHEPEDYIELPMESSRKKLLTEEEAALKRSEVTRRRKNQSLQRAEKDKADTINRLLKKQATKSKQKIRDDVIETKEGEKRKEHGMRYIHNKEGSVLAIPIKYTVEHIFGTHKVSAPKPPRKCEVHGCHQLKKYVAKKSGKLVCSLEHYQTVEGVQ
ncbi:hypothetical protein F4703DRAFT_1871008 [Phycomyces blakesleeanus]